MSVDTAPVDLLRGKLVRLAADDPELLGKAFARWDRDSEYTRLLNTDAEALWSAKKIKEWIEKNFEKEQPEGFFFTIHALQSDRLIGFVGLWGIGWNHGDGWVSVGIGERDYWNNGYGSEAMRLILRYAFTELNLQRVTLCVFDYNLRAMRTYEKAGFIVEGRERQRLRRQGEWADMIFMGILRHEWSEQDTHTQDPKGFQNP